MREIKGFGAIQAPNRSGDAFPTLFCNAYLEYFNVNLELSAFGGAPSKFDDI